MKKKTTMLTSSQAWAIFQYLRYLVHNEYDGTNERVELDARRKAGFYYATLLKMKEYPASEIQSVGPRGLALRSGLTIHWNVGPMMIGPNPVSPDTYDKMVESLDPETYQRVIELAGQALDRDYPDRYRQEEPDPFIGKLKKEALLG